jgi:hypothetical protein
LGEDRIVVVGSLAAGSQPGCRDARVVREGDQAAEYLDWTLVRGQRHLSRILRAYVRHDNRRRPHRGLALALPEPREHGPMPTSAP